MQQNKQRIQEILQISGLSLTNFADLVRVAQLIYDPSGGVSGKIVGVNWLDFGITRDVTINLRDSALRVRNPLKRLSRMRSLGKKYQFESPHVDIDLVWDELTPATRSWFIAHKSVLWEIEESFPALDED